MPVAVSFDKLSCVTDLFITAEMHGRKSDYSSLSIKRLCMDNVVSIDILSPLLFADWGVWIIVCYIRIHRNKL